VPELEWSETARADLLAIVDYISDDNPDAAQRLKDDIEAKAAKLTEFPRLYRIGRIGNTREMVVWSNFIVVYDERLFHRAHLARVARCPAMAARPMTLISMPQWPPISAEQYPEGMPEELVALLPNLHAACVMVLSAVYEHELYRAFGRDRSFIGKVSGTDVAPAIGLPFLWDVSVALAAAAYHSHGPSLHDLAAVRRARNPATWCSAEARIYAICSAVVAQMVTYSVNRSRSGSAPALGRDARFLRGEIRPAEIAIVPPPER
jgi:plasmid stabilization system protein ParE